MFLQKNTRAKSLMKLTLNMYLFIFFVAPGRILDKAPLPPIRKTGHGDTGSILSQDSHESSFSYQNRPMTGVYRSPRKLPKLVGGRTPNVADFGAINDHNPVSDVKLEGALIEQVFKNHFVLKTSRSNLIFFPISVK